MFIYNFRESKLPDISNLEANIDTEMYVLEKQIDTTNNNKEAVYKSFINLSIHTYLSFENVSILNSFNDAFSSSAEIVDKLNNQKEKLLSIQKFVKDTNFNEGFNQNEFLNKLQDLLEDYYDYKNTYEKFIIDENEKIFSLVKTLNKIINTKKETKKIDIKENDKNKLFSTESETKTETKNSNEKSTKKQVKSDIPNNNTLIISEKENKVYLPFFSTDLQQSLLKSKYETYEELIQNDYIFPLKKYRSPVISRFREGYKLMREKEYESFGSSFSFGMKLMNNYKLHPAVISACRNIDELQCFLDCLEDDNLQNFDIFDIKFDIAPSKKNKGGYFIYND